MAKWMRAALAAWVAILVSNLALAQTAVSPAGAPGMPTCDANREGREFTVTNATSYQDPTPTSNSSRAVPATFVCHNSQWVGKAPRDVSRFLGPDGPCADYDPAVHRLFNDDLSQMFTPIRDLGAWVDGTHDAELENIGVVTTARGSPENVLIASNEVGSDGLWLFQSGSVANTGLNMQFTLTDTCLTGTRCHPLKVPVAWLSGWGGNEFCAVMRFGVYVFNPVDDGTDETTVTGGTWDSSVAIGFANLDTTIQNASTGALARGVGTSTWSGDGCLFHLSRAGILSFQCGAGSSNLFLPATGNTVDVSALINHQKAHGYPTFFDVGFRISQEPDGPDINNGSVQGWYRVVPHPGNNNHATVTPTVWTRLGTIASGDDTLPITDPNAQLHFTMEFIQGTGNTDPDDGLEVFLGAISAFQMHGVAIHDDTWPHHN